MHVTISYPGSGLSVEVHGLSRPDTHKLITQYGQETGRTGTYVPDRVRLTVEEETVEERRRVQP